MSRCGAKRRNSVHRGSAMTLARWLFYLQLFVRWMPRRCKPQVTSSSSETWEKKVQVISAVRSICFTRDRTKTRSRCSSRSIRMVRETTSRLGESAASDSKLHLKGLVDTVSDRLDLSVLHTRLGMESRSYHGCRYARARKRLSSSA